MLRVGLTGGIATGKSHVRRRFEAAGLATLDLDQVTHELLAADGAARQAVAEAFGPGLLAPDGSVDRRALGALVFRDPAARARLNALVHPLIRAESDRRAAELEARGTPVLVIEAALLVETGGHLRRFDRLVVVYCSVPEQLERLVRRDGLERPAAEARLRAQMPIDDKRLFAHLAISSSGQPDETDRRADEAARGLVELARTPPARVALSEAAVLGCLRHGPARGPRGLSPARLMEELAAHGGVELQALVARLEPVHEGPWYQAACLEAGDPGPETLAGPLALWSLVRRGADESFLAGAAAALARLTHVHAAAVARAVVAAGLVFDAAVEAALTPALHARVAHWARQAVAFGGRLDDAWPIEATLRAALETPGDPRQAARRAAERGGDAGLAGALVGLCSGPQGSPGDDEALVGAVRELLRAAGFRRAGVNPARSSAAPE